MIETFLSCTPGGIDYIKAKENLKSFVRFKT